MALPTASDNQFPKVILEEVTSDGSATVTPAADHRALFLGEDGILHLKDSAGSVSDVGGSGSTGYAEGTSFPGGPTTNDKYYRTDRNLLYYYDGTRWLTTTLYIQPLTAYAAVMPRTVNSDVLQGPMGHSPTYDTWLVNLVGASYVATTNTGSAYWTFALWNIPTGSTVASYTTAADSANTWTSHVVAINALGGTTQFALRGLITKTGSPGACEVTAAVTYRLVG